MKMHPSYLCVAFGVLMLLYGVAEAGVSANFAVFLGAVLLIVIGFLDILLQLTRE